MERFKQLGEQLSNWGRWGPDDERGTLNLITAARLAHAGSLVRHGRLFSLSLPVGSGGPQTGSSPSGRINPIHLVSVLGGDLAFTEGMEVSDDWLILPLQAGTQWDGLGHIGYDGRLYNDVPSSSIRAMGGARRLSLDYRRGGCSLIRLWAWSPVVVTMGLAGDRLPGRYERAA